MRALFLDRDGVLNVENPYGYILSWDKFLFEENVLKALVSLREYFDVFVVVTNQRCVGKGLITEDGLQFIHQNMIEVIQNHGGQIDQVYYAPDINDNHPLRKPNIGMGLQVLNDFPEIIVKESYMVGNNLSDMEFGRGMGLQTVYLTTTSGVHTLPHELIDYQFDSLYSFAQFLQEK